MNLSELNPQQQEAVINTEGPLLILAGAGSGKTKVLTNRVAYLIYEKKIAPWHILAITFTNKAAKEMKERIIDLIGTTGERVWAATFHSTCVRLLREEIDHLGYDKNFVIYDDSDQQTVIKRVLKEINLDEKKYTPRAISNYISNCKNELLTPLEASKAAFGSFTEEQMASIYTNYQEKLLKNNALDFDDIIMLTVQMFMENPDVLDKYQERFKYIMVDEYQDTNTSQYTLIRLLAQKYRNLCVVGDDDQSIYQWRGADIKNILDFEKDYPEAKVVKLEENYRSTQIILNAAYEVVKNNPGRKHKKLWTQKKDGDKIAYYTGLDESDEAFFITRQIRQIKDKEQRRNQDFAILCRTTAQFRSLEECMIKQGIAYKVFGGTKFYSRKEIKDVLAYLRILVNPADEISTNRALNSPKRGVGETSWGRLVQYANTQYVTIGQALIAADQAGVGKKIAATMQSFAGQMEVYRTLSKEMDITSLTQMILEDTGYLQELQLDDTIESETRMENLEEFLAITQAFDAAHIGEGERLETFLSEVALFTDLDGYADQEDMVTIMTMHSAKGLEFPVVFMVGMEEGLFPHSRSINSLESNEIDEERRLCYVAITRAKERLYLTRADARKLYGRTNRNAASRFIAEIPTDIVENLNARVPTKMMAMDHNMNTQTSQSGEGNTVNYQLGDKVLHKKWGEGVIVSAQGEGEGLELKVAFPDMGIKNLIAKYAPIVKVE